MPDIEFPPDLVAAQRRADAAWAAVEEHRKAVDAARRAEAVEDRDRPKWASPELRPWTAEESARHEELMAEVREAAEARSAALSASGLGTGQDVVKALHAAARPEE
jgi:hypothetical protein